MARVSGEQREAEVRRSRNTRPPCVRDAASAQVAVPVQGSNRHSDRRQRLVGMRPTRASVSRAWRMNIRALASAALGFGIEIVPFAARSEEEVVRAIAAMKATRVEAVNLLASQVLWSKFRSLIRDRLDLHRLPAIWQWPEGAEEGGLIAYGPRLSVVSRQCARQVAKLLHGAKVVDVPVEQPTVVELIINLKTAKTLGVEIPPALLSRTDQVID